MSAPPSTIPAAVVREHIERLRELLRPTAHSAVLVFDSSNMLAFTGTPHASSDRITCGFVTREGAVGVICPAFERPAVAGALDTAAVRTWEEHECPYQCLAAALAAAGVRTGSIAVDGRAWVRTWLRLRAICTQYDFVDGENLLREVRICKSAAERELMFAAHGRGERVFFRTAELLQAGISEYELQERMKAEFAADGLRLDPLVQSGPNAAIPHNPTGRRRLQPGDTVVVDSVTSTAGYTNDLTRTYAVGEPSRKVREAYRAVRRAQQAAIETARPGVTCGDVDRVARAVIAEAGFGPHFLHRLGHGIGIECHEPPYLVGGNPEVLRPGMCMTVEPGIYVRDEFGIRIEDDILITADGCEVIHGELKTDVTDAFDR